MNPFQKILEHKIVVALTLTAGVVFTLWEPIISLFYTGYFHTNIVLDMNVETMPLNKNSQLLVIHIDPSNKGNVPVVIKDKKFFRLEIRRIDNPINQQWIEPEKLKLVNQTEILRNILTDKKSSYTIEPNGIYEEVESIALPNGIYWINAVLEDSDSFVNQSNIVKIPPSK